MSIRPLQAAQLFSFIYLMISTIIALYSLKLLFLSSNNSADRSSLILLISITVSNSILFFYLYILGAYVGRSYLEIKKRPSYIIDEIYSDRHE